MFDQHARSLFVDFPELEGFLAEDAVRALSQAYLAVLEFRVNGSPKSIYDLDSVQPFLRRLANTLLFHVVLDEEREDASRQAAAFVAAEAIALMADYIEAANSEEDDNSETGEQYSPRSSEHFARVEASLLYLYAQYDACAAGVLRDSDPLDNVEASLVDVAAEWCFVRLERLCSMRMYPPISSEFEYVFASSDKLNPGELEIDTLARLYIELGIAAVDFSSWLLGTARGFAEAIARLDRMLAALRGQRVKDSTLLCGHEFSRIFHLCTLLRLVLPAIGERSLVHVVPAPPGATEFYQGYLRSRALGSNQTMSRPVLWPSAYEYVKHCVIGDARNAVIAMPTGSGKSFVGELAVSQVVQTGWALYLAPTNALTEQIRGDLGKGLKELETEIFAFIGDQEYSIFTSDRVDQMPTNSVAVMTPEKCALALRLSPDAFKDCRLVVFDECHLLGDTGSARGPLSELVLTQLMLRCENVRFLLMSALVQNPEELAEWLTEATGQKSDSVVVRWRPTRTLRGVLGVDNESVRERADEAIEWLKGRADRIKKRSFTSKCALAVNLQGPWQSEKKDDYAVCRLECEAPLKVSRKKRLGKWAYYWEGDSWVNQCAISLATRLTEANIQTLVFIPANKHYPFNNALKVELPEGFLERLPTRNDIVETCRVLSEYELGVESQVFTLLDKGVAVHTSLMLETEKIAAESTFRSRSAPLMFATGTLAQGLNLPAIAVVIAGSRIGDPRGDEAEEVQRRKFSQLLNAAGRAGRAGFANQGVVVAVPDRPVAFSNFDSISDARVQVDYLQQYDAVVRIESGLTRFLDTVCADALRPDQSSDVELQVLSLLAGGDDSQIEPLPILERTYAAYLRRQQGRPGVTEKNANSLKAVAGEFVKATGAPTWLPIAAQRAGLDFFLTLGISRAWGRVRSELPRDIGLWTVQQWVDELLDVVACIPPGILVAHLPAEKLKHISGEFKDSIEKNDKDALLIRDLSWSPSGTWINAWKSAARPLNGWMKGDTIAEIASTITKIDVNDISTDRTGGKPIPKALSVCQDTWSTLALIAGGLLSIAEQILGGEVPLNLASLPLCVKYGCSSPGELAWFRFGVRLRRASRLLAKIYPPPPLTSDDELKQWVRTKRSEWLKMERDEQPLVAAIRAFITQH